MVLKMNSGLLNQELLNAKISESAFPIKDRIQWDNWVAGVN